MVAMGTRIVFLLAANALGDMPSGGLKYRATSVNSTSTVAAPIVVRLVRASQTIGGLSFFVGRVAVGDESQKFEVLFDTASGNVILPSSKCKSAACLEHHQYLTKGSQDGTVAEIEFSQMELGDGVVTGGVVSERLCMGRTLGSQAARGNTACAENLEVVSAETMTDVPFRAMHHDGIVGLGLEELWLGPKSGFLSRLASSISGLRRQFSISLGRNEGELSFGGYDTTRITEPLEWFPVAREREGFWQVWISRVRVGNHTIDPCLTGCRAIIDTGASGLAVPKALLLRLRAALAPSPATGVGCKGPNLHLDLGDAGNPNTGTALWFKAEDYAGPACEPQLMPFDSGEARFANVFVLGVNMLRPYQTVFDWGAKRIGFSRSKGRFVRLGVSEVPDSVSEAAASNLMMV